MIALCLRSPIYQGKLRISVFGIYSNICDLFFGSTLSMPSYFRQTQIDCYSHTKNKFHASTHSCDIGLSEILQSDLSKTS